MRLRNLKDKDIIINNCKYLINNPEEYIGKWHKLFKNNNPIKLEIGMGKGDFIYNMALKYPEINFIGIEKYEGVIARAIKKYPLKLDNLYIIRMDAKELNKVFKKEIDTIYLNFSDPWPKERQKNRRLTSLLFLKIYDELFRGEKTIIMKTDNINLFASSIVNLSTYGYTLVDVNLDFDSIINDSIITEYETRYRSLGIKINYLVAKKD